MVPFLIRPTDENDRAFIREFITHRWHGEAVVAHGVIFYPAELPGLIAFRDQEIVGLITYQIKKGQCEIITLDSILEGQGVGTELLQSVKKTALEQGCRCLTLITTNNNLPALGFYQKHGFKIKNIFTGAIEKSRELKPSIPLLGANGIPIRDEILLEMSLRS
jgi:ribosomal protein S18 acetylase RimI-like enzyme